MRRFSRLDQYTMGLSAPPRSRVLLRREPETSTKDQNRRRDRRLVQRHPARRADRRHHRDPRPAVPSAAESPKVHRQAFIYIVSAGRATDGGQVAKLERIRRQWEDFFCRRPRVACAPIPGSPSSRSFHETAILPVAVWPWVGIPSLRSTVVAARRRDRPRRTVAESARNRAHRRPAVDLSKLEAIEPLVRAGHRPETAAGGRRPGRPSATASSTRRRSAIAPWSRRDDDARHDLRPRVADQGDGHDHQRDAAGGGRQARLMDRVSTFIPGFERYGKADITVRHL